MIVEHALYIRFAGALIALLTPIVVYIIAGRHKSLVGVMITILVSVAVMYIFIAGPLFLLNYKLDQAVAALDYDGDGIWSPEEEKQWSEEDHRVMQMFIGDGGRNVFGYLLSPIFSFVYSAILFAVFNLTKWAVEKLRSHKHA